MAAWTEAQQSVIDTRDKNILVSAAAGSGKTAVLVERIIRRILDPVHPVDVDKLMVVTFTNAAAGEMRERILRAIEKELAVNPDNLHLRKQQVYIHNAYITTIHSFCLHLVKEHFEDIDLDPGVRVADPGEMELLKSDVVREVLDEFYDKKEEDFFRFVEQFEDGTSDDYLETMILALYRKAMGYPWPEQFLSDCVRYYEYEGEEALNDSPYVRILNQFADGTLQEILSQYDAMLAICRNGGPFMYVDTLTREQEMIREILSIQDFNRRKVKLNMTFDRLPTCSKQDCDPERKKMVTDSRDDVKTQIGKLKKQIYSQTLGEGLEQIRLCHDVILTYTNITRRFIERLKEKKKKKNLIDFDDFEHYAVDILVRLENGKVVPTRTADELAGDFEEIMVDEYQDSNMVQETILQALSRERFGRHNRFMVGDVKQSIYGFRGANPDIFVDKYHRYQTDPKQSDFKIILDKNFRSRLGVIDTTNYLFSQIMGKELGNIDYDEENQLYYGALYPEAAETGLSNRIDDKTELILIDTNQEAITPEENGKPAEDLFDSGEEDIPATALETEAKVIAKRIRELTDREKGMVVFDKESSQYRPLRYSDIVILLRSIGENADYISEELQKAGIPVYMESKTGYFKTPEIKMLVNYLKIIDNPTQDIPMMAVLRSPFVNLSDSMIAKIRSIGGKETSLHDNLRLYMDISEEDNQTVFYLAPGLSYDWKLKKKIQAFFDQLQYFRERVKYLSIYDLVSEVMEKTGYDDFVSAMPAGFQRMANVSMFLSKAADYEKGSYKGLFNFIRYIEKMDKFNVDLGEASMACDSDNTVRIMTIHKSKGLEFPVVFLANIQKRFNLMDTRKKMTIHAKLGIGMDFIDSETRVMKKNLVKYAINRKIILETIEEEMRLFYVACTRAKDKLIFTGSGVDEKRLAKMFAKRFNTKLLLGFGVVSRFNSYLDFITVPLGRNKAMGTIGKEILGLEPVTENPLYHFDSHIQVNYLRMSDVVYEQMKNQYDESVSLDGIRNLDESKVYQKEVKEEMEQILAYRYPYQKEILAHAKMSVSEIKKTAFSEENEEERLAKEERRAAEKAFGIPEISGAARGTLYHRVFEKFDYGLTPDYQSLSGMLDRFEENSWLSQEEKKSIRIKDFLTFTKTDLYQRMKAAFMRGELYREQQFVVGIEESQIEEWQRIAAQIADKKSIQKPHPVEPEGDRILIQGIIDALFMEDDRLILIDYKTDHVEEEQELVNRYYIQLLLYQKAIEQITGRQVTEKYLYSTRLGKEIRMP